ncbi:hypothetical protein D3C72_1241500 [compost metagenome]
MVFMRSASAAAASASFVCCASALARMFFSSVSRNRSVALSQMTPLFALACSLGLVRMPRSSVIASGSLNASIIALPGDTISIRSASIEPLMGPIGAISPRLMVPGGVALRCRNACCCASGVMANDATRLLISVARPACGWFWLPIQAATSRHCI